MQSPTIKMVRLGIRLPLTGAEIPKIGQRGFQSQKKPPLPPTPEKGVPSQKIPIFLVVLCIEMGIFCLETPFSGVVGNGLFFAPKPSFPDSRRTHRVCPKTQWRGSVSSLLRKSTLETVFRTFPIVLGLGGGSPCSKSRDSEL